MSPEEPYRYVGDDGNDLARQSIQKLLQPALILRHSDVESMNRIAHSYSSQLLVFL